MQKATQLALTLFVILGLGVCANSAQARSDSSKKKSSSGSSSKAHRAKSSRRSGRRERGQKAPTPDRISEIQQALAKDGSFAGMPNGKWDSATVDAMKKFQEAHGLNPSGKVDAKSLQQLGLGSQTAGVAPPLPPVSSSGATSPAVQSMRRQQ
ncbi:MAG: peptidoglycan-binding domain-containing protein [Candidatus Acidiferrales bacterium]